MGRNCDLLLKQQKAGLSVDAFMVFIMSMYACTGHKKELGIETMGTFRQCPNCLVLDHLVLTINMSSCIIISQRVNCFFGSNSDIELGIIFDFLAIKKNIRRRRDHITTSIVLAFREYLLKFLEPLFGEHVAWIEQ